MTTEIAGEPLSTTYADYNISHVVGVTKAIQEVMASLLKDGEHYGTIPGTPKPTLLQPGADKLCVLFWLKPEFTVTERIVRDDLIMYEVKCVLKHRRTGEEWGEGDGACNSREKRYQSQTVEKTCPKCQKAGSIMRGKPDYAPKGRDGKPQPGFEKGGWLCWKKKDGCGVNFTDDDPEITGQEGQTKKDGVYDLQNTIRKMANKRAKVAAVLTAVAASDLFTQDLEDLTEAQAHYSPPKESAPPPSHLSVVATPGAGAPAESTREPGSDDDEEEIAGEPLERVWCYDPATGEQLREEPKASRSQIARIHILRVECGLTEDEYKARIKELFCKESTGELSVREASMALDKLEERKKRWGGAKERQAREAAKNNRKAQRAAPENVPPEMVELLNEHPE
jgi:hypothetical protein